MNLSWLDDFLALDSTGNFSRAAEKRHMTQPAFGRRIKALEEWIGTELFDRSVHPVRLTAAGEWFRTKAAELLDQIALVPGEARRIAEETSSSLTFAATHALSFSFLPYWLHEFDALTTRGRVQISSDVLQRCEAHLEHNQVQFVICHAHPDVPGKLDSDGYESLVIGEEVLIPVSIPGPIPEKPLFSLFQSEGSIPLLAYSDGSGLGRILKKTRRAEMEQSVVTHAFSAHLASVLKSMVLDGKGFAWLPKALINDDLNFGRLVAAAPSSWNVDLEVRLYRRSVNIGFAAEQLWSAAQANG